MPPLEDILRESSPDILLIEVCLVKVEIGICDEIYSRNCITLGWVQFLPTSARMWDQHPEGLGHTISEKHYSLSRTFVFHPRIGNCKAFHSVTKCEKRSGHSAAGLTEVLEQVFRVSVRDLMRFLALVMNKLGIINEKSTNLSYIWHRTRILYCTVGGYGSLTHFQARNSDLLTSQL